MTGDFNYPDINWNLCTIVQGAHDRQVQQELVEISTEAQLTQVQDHATREENNLDLVFTSNPSLVKNCTPIPGISDHCIVVTDVEIEPQRIKEKPRQIFHWKKAAWSNIDEDMDKSLERIQKLEIENASVEEMWTDFKNSVHEAVKKFIPSRLQKMNSKLPLVNGQTCRMIRKKKRMRGQAKKTNKWIN